MAKVVIVDENDKEIGAVEKLEAVQKALIRRISAVILFDGKGKILLQRRSKNKKSYALCWEASATGHVDEGETYEVAAYRELKEELGVENIRLYHIDKVFTTKKEDRNGLPKFTALFVGKFTGKFDINDLEVEEVKWFIVDDVVKMTSDRPLSFVPTFTNMLLRSKDKLKKLK